MNIWKQAYVATAIGGLLIIVLAAPRAWGVGDGGGGPAQREGGAAGGRPRYVYAAGFFGGK